MEILIITDNSRSEQHETLSINVSNGMKLSDFVEKYRQKFDKEPNVWDIIIMEGLRFLTKEFDKDITLASAIHQLNDNVEDIEIAYNKHMLEFINFYGFWATELHFQISHIFDFTKD